MPETTFDLRKKRKKRYWARRKQRRKSERKKRPSPGRTSEKVVFTRIAVPSLPRCRIIHQNNICASAIARRISSEIFRIPTRDMGVCSSKSQLRLRLANSRNTQIDQLNQISHDIDVSVKKLLLLGAGESGKSTIFKQIQSLYGKGFSDKQIEQSIPLIYNNVILSMRTLCEENERLASGDEAYKVQCPESAEFVLDLQEDARVMNDEIAFHTKTLWSDPAIQRTYSQRSSFQLPDSSAYFFEIIDVLNSPEYRPSKQDILRVRIRTSGILETEFEIEGLHFKLMDVGGQRNERKKWVHCFDDVTALLFVTAISEYDQMLYEDSSVNRIHESLLLFDEIVNGPYFKNSAIMLFLNKKDLFDLKISSSPLTVCFPEYSTEDKLDPLNYMASKFLEVRADPERDIYVHVTCATDDENVLHVFEAIRKTIVKEGMANSGF